MPSLRQGCRERLSAAAGGGAPWSLCRIDAGPRENYSLAGRAAPYAFLLTKSSNKGVGMLNTVYGACLLVATSLLVVALRPRDGKEKRLVRLPGMWILLGLLLTTSFGAGIALLAMGVGIL
jgi:hypothetical protein